MSSARAVERAAHDELRERIRVAALAHWDRRIAEGAPDEELLVETRHELEAGLLVDYVVVAVFDAGEDHNVTAVLRTDGSCAQYRTVGLLEQALNDTL